MKSNLLYFLRPIIGGLLIGYLFSLNRPSYLKVNIPGWFNKILFIFRKNRPVSLIAVIWQVIIYLTFLAFIIGVKIKLISNLGNTANIFEDNFKYFFIVFTLSRVIDAIIGNIKENKNKYR